jgi:ribose transport system substrate-binding protein
MGTKIEIVDTRTDDADAVRAKSNAADAIVKYPDIKALVGLWSYNGPAILSAVKDARKTGQIRIVAFDEADETLRGIQDGLIHGTVVQQPYEFGYQAIKLMDQVLKGDKSVIPANRQIIIPTLVVNKANVEEFTRKINDLRGK